MIKLLVEDYCHGCPEFEAVSIKGQVWRRNELGNDVLVDNFEVRCAHRMKCLGIRNFLKKENNKGK